MVDEILLRRSTLWGCSFCSGFFLCALNTFHASQISGKLSFGSFGTGFLEILNWVLPKLQNFNQNSVFFEENLWKNMVLEEFWTEFLANNWVFRKFGELGFQKFQTGFFSFAQKSLSWAQLSTKVIPKKSLH